MQYQSDILSPISYTYQKEVANRFINYTVLAIFLLQPLLGVTVFDGAQIFLEIIAILLLSTGVLLNGVIKVDAFLIALLGFFSVVSFLLNDFNTFALNFKMFSLTVLVISYYSRVNFIPYNTIFFFVSLNVFYAVYVEITDHYFLGLQSIMKQQGVYVDSRPIGFLGSPHATSTLISIYLLYMFIIGKYKIFQFLCWVSLYLYASWTAVAAIISQLLFILFRQVTHIRVNQFVFFIVFYFAVIWSGEFLLEVMRDIPGSRYYSVEALLPRLVDYRYFSQIFTLYPQDPTFITEQQLLLYADTGNEFGIVKIFIEGGFVLAALLIYRMAISAKYMVVYMFVTTLHYSYFTNIPLITFLLVVLNKDIYTGSSLHFNNNARLQKLGINDL